ncbi:hypothetical protein TSAR_006159 [Trichomalopsis sarcophagae]|uniref:Reverse transcriptase domain-containing protein n=1 Tax=Trichomalopsis sarcophagae TaxID=543379 RepID=A0A232F0Q2_9HYME|nr:hypothetical protein TSAR_006159 [Trichomalopsis sarcophagae]
MPSRSSDTEEVGLDGTLAEGGETSQGEAGGVIPIQVSTRSGIVMSDLNANLLSSSQDAAFVRELACELNLKLIDHGPTHPVGDSQTWIDVIYTDDDNVVLSSNNTMAPFSSRHNLIDVEIEFATLAKPRVLHDFTYRDFKSIRQDELLTLLSSCDWLFVAGDDSVNDKLEQICSNLMKYQALAADTEQRIKEARESFIHNRIFEALENNKNVWSELRYVTLLPKVHDELHGFTPDDLNYHFASVSISGSERDANLEDILSKAGAGGFKFREVTFFNVVLAVAHFSTQAKSDEGIPQSVIAKSLPVMDVCLAGIFSTSLSSGVFPSVWKRAHLVLLKKKSIPSAVSDFRPIALLSFLAKVLEKIVYDQILEFISSHRLLDSRQSGFRQDHSTQTALLKITEDIREGIDSKQQLLTILLLFDFSKAFDKISPSKLLQKNLIGQNELLRSDSDWLTTNLGVPQGSVLGPFLFMLYINDLSEAFVKFRGPKGVLESSFDYLLYADDLQVYARVDRDHLHEGIDRLSAVARAVSAWASENVLHLNVQKTQSIIFGSDNNVSKLQEYDLLGIEVQDNVYVPFTDCITEATEIPADEIPPFTEGELIAVTLSLKGGREPGLNGMPAEVLRIVALQRPELLLEMYN